MSRPLPGRPAHNLELPTVSGDRWVLKDASPDRFSMIVFYRGLHCPICKTYLTELESRLAEFSKRGVEAVAVSCDDEQRARQSAQEWGIRQLPVAYGLRIDEARSWDLYISSAIKDGEPDQFCEPGLFLVRPDRTVYAAAIQSMPFARPSFDDLLGAIDFIGENDYPPRGTVEHVS